MSQKWQIHSTYCSGQIRWSHPWHLSLSGTWGYSTNVLNRSINTSVVKALSTFCSSNWGWGPLRNLPEVTQLGSQSWETLTLFCVILKLHFPYTRLCPNVDPHISLCSFWSCTVLQPTVPIWVRFFPEIISFQITQKISLPPLPLPEYQDYHPQLCSIVLHKQLQSTLPNLFAADLLRTFTLFKCVYSWCP